MDGITEETVTAVTADPGILNVMLMGIGVVSYCSRAPRSERRR